MARVVSSLSLMVLVVFIAWATLSLATPILSTTWAPNGHILERHPEAAVLFDSTRPGVSKCYRAPELDRQMRIFELPGQDPCDENRRVGVVFLTASGVVVTGLFMAFRRAMKIVMRDGYQ